ncbi:hypothetical protein F2P81_019030 [Scophthalmus maximus]|uniref:Cystine/glutamate transporter-like n=1 Tax=Scophthalmus maximus TaxID=52904 RepID=A0A6A4SBV9_SCOMX|nr:hypothetical protein F2P81_019030 [Scophthalmus maximus]
MDGTKTKKKKKDEEEVHLRREIGLLSAMSFIIGTVVGSGIFIAPKGVLLNSGSVGLSLLVWALCGVLSLCGALCFAELGTTFTKSGGQYIYLLETLGPLPAFVCLWADFFFIQLTFANRAFQAIAPVIPVLVALSCLGALNGGIFGSPRMQFVGGREGHWPRIFSMIHIRRRTPLPAVMLQYPLVVVMLLRGEIYKLVNFASFSRWFFIALATLGMLIHRYRFPLHPRPFKVPVAVAVTVTVVCFFIVGLSLYSDPWSTGCSCALTLSGVPVYYVTVYRFLLPKRFRRIFNYFSEQLQILLEVAQQEVQTY